MFLETKLRSIVKTISWRFWATLTTVALVFFFIGEVRIALEIGFIEVILKMLIYFFHERTWNKIKFGKREIKPAVIWLTGLVRSGKSEIARLVTEKLKAEGLKAEHLDGHTIRNLFPETGFSKSEVNEHIKRVGYLAKKLETQGVFTIASFVSPYRESREFVKNLSNNFIEVYISTPADVCAQRDINGLYESAKKGEINNFPGVNTEYEKPLNSDIELNTENLSHEEAADKIFEFTKKYFQE